MEQTSIQTAVDKLVALVNEKGKISFKDAAKLLAAPVQSIEEWAYMLEEEHVLAIEYKLHVPYLTTRQLTVEQKEEKKQSFVREHKLFNQKVEAATSYFNELDKKITLVRELFEDMSGNMDDKLQKVNQDITNLVQAEARKNQLDNQVLEAKKRSIEKLRQVDEHIRQLKSNYEIEYEQSKKVLSDDQQQLALSNKFLDRARQQETMLQQKLAEVTALSKQIQEEASTRAKMLAHTQLTMDELKHKHEVLLKELEQEHNKLTNLITENERQEQTIKKSQDEIFAKIEAEEKSLDKKVGDIRELPARFTRLMEKRTEIHDLLASIGHEEIELKSQIQELQKRAKMLEYAVGPTEFVAELAALSKKIDAINGMRAFFREKVLRLNQLLDTRSLSMSQDVAMTPPPAPSKKGQRAIAK